MKTKFLLLLFCWVSLTVYGQKEERPHGADFYHNDYDLSDEDFLKLPWVGDYDNLLRAIQEKQYLLDLYTNNRNTDCDYLFDGEDLSNDPIVFVPVYFYVYRAPSNDPIVPTEAEVRALTDYTNTLLANSGSQIRLSIACIQFPIEADYVIIQDSDELDDMMQEYVDGPGLNVHIVNIGYGWSGIYNTDQDGLALIRGEVVNDPTETLAHELGHFFSLPHTHRATNLDISAANGDGFNVPCFREAVSRNLVFDFGCFNWPWGLPFSHCSWTGDGFCDTPADPNGDSCNYNEDWVDFRGEAFVPDEDNIMSYYDCTSSFSPMQVNAMWNNLLNRLAGSWSDILNGDFVVSDSYEPNNDEDEAGLIAVGETQIHTLHDNCITDEDWFAIEPGQALGDYIIHVEKLPDCDWPVDDVDVLYKNFLGNMVNFIPASVVPLNGKFYITIDCQEVANEELFIRVENNSKPEGAYKIYMESSEGNASIDGPEVICQNQSYEVIDIPSGASVTWSATPGLNLSCLSCNPTTIQSVGGASTYTIEALVSDNGCDIKLEQELTNSATIIPPFFIEEIIPACYHSHYRSLELR
ncbi:MAG: M43 family zinc metalloprotease [Bacteroidota bacterium]